MGVIDERDSGQSFWNWFVHGSRVKKERKTQVISDIEAERKAEQLLKQEIPKKAFQPIGATAEEMIVETKPEIKNELKNNEKPSEKDVKKAEVPVQKTEKGNKGSVGIKYPKFVLSRQKLTPLPLDVKEAIYPLISPYSYADIKDTDGSIEYSVIEPKLDEKEKEAMEKLKAGLVHFIDIPMTSIKSEKELLDFLEEKVQWLLRETDIYIDEKSYLKIMYYLYRDFVGLNQIEPLLKDPFIEEQEPRKSVEDFATFLNSEGVDTNFVVDPTTSYDNPGILTNASIMISKSSSSPAHFPRFSD